MLELSRLAALGVVLTILVQSPDSQVLAQDAAASADPLANAPMDPAYAKLSAADKAMFSDKTETSHFSGDMYPKEAEFAKQQGSEQELFGLSSQEKQRAKDQSRVWLNKEDKETVDYLSTEDAVSDQDLKDLTSIRKSAAAKADKIREELRKLQEDTAAPDRSQQTQLQHTMEAIGNNIDEEQEESMDLGEGAGVGDGAKEDPKLKEQVEKAKKKAQVQMDAVNARHEQEVETFKETMKEVTKKADEVQLAATKKASQMVPEAVKEFDQKDADKRQTARKKVMDLKDFAEAEFRKKTAKALQDKQQATLLYTSESNELTAKQSKFHMDTEANYEKKLAAIEEGRTKEHAQAREYLVQARADIQQQDHLARAKAMADAQTLKSKFDRMKGDIDERSNALIQKMSKVEMDAKSAAELSFKNAKSDSQKKSQMVSMQHAQVKKQADVLLAEARSDEQQAADAKDNIMRTQMKFKEDELARQHKLKMEFGNIEKEDNKFELNVQQERKEVDEKQKVRDQAEANRGEMSEEEYKKRQMKWLETVKTSANKNCDDAKKEAILRTRGSRIATLRLSRMSQDMLLMKQKVLEDLQSKNKKAFDLKEKAGKHLKKVVAEQATAMKESPESYDASTVQNAAVEYSKIAGPEKSEEERIKEATEKVTEARKAAAERSPTWAKTQNIKTGKNLQATAEALCHKEQHKYETVKYRVRKRLGLASESDHKALMKGEYEDKKWAMRKVSVMLGKKQAITEASEKKKVQLTQEEQRKELKAEREEKDTVNKFKEKVRKFAQSAQFKEQKAETSLKTEAGSQSIKIEESTKMMEVSENTYKSEVKSAQKKLEEGKKKIEKESKKEHTDLVAREEQAMEALQKNSVSNSHEPYERAKKKSEEMIKKTDQRSQELTEKVTKKRDKRTQEHNDATDQQRAKLKTDMEDAKQSADKRHSEAKVVLTRKHNQADVVEKEASARDDGARNTAQFEAETKAQDLINSARKIHQQAVKAAKDDFAAKVKQATDEQVKNIKAIKESILASFAPQETQLDEATELIQLTEATHNANGVMPIVDLPWKNAWIASRLEIVFKSGQAHLAERFERALGDAEAWH